MWCSPRNKQNLDRSHWNPLKRIHSAWQQKTPKQKWQFFFNFGKFFVDTIQIRIFSDCRIGWLGWLPSANCFGYFSLIIYTVHFYISSGRLQECLLCFCFLGIMTTVSKISTILFSRSDTKKVEF